MLHCVYCSCLVSCLCRVMSNVMADETSQISYAICYIMFHCAAEFYTHRGVHGDYDAS